MKTFVLLLYLGWFPPIQIEGYHSYDACDDAGKEAVASLCLKDRKCRHVCLLGPKQAGA